jgi:hypothetical protein
MIMEREPHKCRLFTVRCQFIFVLVRLLVHLFTCRENKRVVHYWMANEGHRKKS